jgi:hypothetical protein
MRPRKSVNVAALVGSPEDEPSRPNLRLRVVGVAVLVLFLVLVLRLWTLQIIEGKTYAAAVTRNQVRVVSVAAPRGEIVDRNDTVLVSNVPAGGDPALARQDGREHRTPRIIGKVAALIGETPAQVRRRVKNDQLQPLRAGAGRHRVSRRPRCSTCRRTSRSIPASASRRSRSAPTPREGPRPPTCSGTWATSPAATSPPPQGRLHPGQPGRAVGDRRAVRALPAGRQREPGPLGRRRRQTWSARSRHRPPDRRHGRAQHRHRTAAGGAERPGRRRSSWTARRPTSTDQQQAAAGHQRRRHRDEPPERPGAGHGLVPTYDLNEWVGGISTAELRRAAGGAGRRTTTPFRGSTPRARPSS